jgi:UDP-N-acetylglucosamine 2-epimerase (non-hydrolysing)
MAKNVLCIVGTRPNLIKAGPLMRELRKHPQDFKTTLVHTGQHYDRNLSQLLFEDLGMAAPDINLGVGSGTHAEQTAKVMVALETTIQEQASELVIVFGDVNSTMAGAIVAAKLCVKIAHVESGLRSFDRTMPEEINRIVTDHLSDYLFVSEPSGLENLKREGIADGKVFFTGNIMIDSLLSTLDVVKRSDVIERLGLTPRRYAVMTLHRPSNVDDPATLGALLGTVSEVSARMPVVFPCHPRTRHNIEKFGLGASVAPSVVMTEPLGYTDFSRLTYESAFVLTDSGGIQEETTFLKVPCITMRDNTERPVTVTVGSNVMTGNDRAKILAAVRAVVDGAPKPAAIPDLWDGHTAERIVEILKNV